MNCELVTLIGPAEAVAVSASRAVPDIVEIALSSIIHLPLRPSNTYGGGLRKASFYRTTILASLFQFVPLQDALKAHEFGYIDLNQQQANRFFLSRGPAKLSQRNSAFLAE